MSKAVMVIPKLTLDMELFNEQKLTLVKYAMDKTMPAELIEALEGVINMMDNIQDNEEGIDE